MDEHKILHINNRSMLFTYIEITIYFFLLTSTLPQFHCQPPPQPVNDNSTCKGQPYNCGPLHNISYPFWGHNRPQQCGGGNLFRLNCGRHQNTTTIQIGPQNFIVLHINTGDYTIQMKRTDLDHDVCAPQFDDTYSSPNLFRYDQSVENITIFYNCSSNKDFPNSMCGPQNAFCHVGNEDQFLPRCQRRIHIQVPAGFHPGIISQYDLEQGLKQGFQVNYIVNEECVRCLGSEGNCSNIIDIEKLVWSKCHYSYCPADGSIVSAALNCPVLNASHKSKQLNWQGKITLGIVGAAFARLFLCITIFCFKYKSSTWHEKFSLATKSDQDIEAFLKTHEGIIIKRYKFSYIKLMTYNFRIKIGQGGFGSVYKGELHNGSPAAIKMLKASKENGKDFINEVASISRTSHINIVTLLGFCFEDRKKALIYEFMPNSSLDKFIYNEQPETIASLSWENLYEVAKGIAQGLEYLHRGCSTKIFIFRLRTLLYVFKSLQWKFE